LLKKLYIFMKNILFVISGVFCLFSNPSISQIVEPTIITALPTCLHESSGIEAENTNSIWTHNDSGDSARIYQIDTLGNILRNICFQVDSAIDCEESTRDTNGNYYLGDFGNNSNDRTNLRIYKITNPDSITTSTIIPELITFRFEDQELFPPDSAHMDFDCEAMFHFQDSLYLFSKNRSGNMFCKMYRLPDVAGDYIAELVDSFNTGTWITSADINAAGNKMVLLSESRLWLFSDIQGTNFFDGNAQMFNMYFSQKEAVVFVDDSTLYLTDEYLFGTGGNLLRICMNELSSTLNEKILNQPWFYPNPAMNHIQINPLIVPDHFTIVVSDMKGNKILFFKNKTEIDLYTLKSGIYCITLIMPDQTIQSSFIKID